MLHESRQQLLTTDKKATQTMIKPSDASVWASCIRRVWLDKHQAGQVNIGVSDFDQLLRDSGLEYETAVLTKLQQQYIVHKAYSIKHTRELMQQHVPVIYQGRLLDEQQSLIGYPDFLILHESGHYQAADVKLSHSANKKSIQIQLGLYRRILNNQLPALVFLGDGNTATLGDETKPLVDRFITDMEALLAMDEQPTVRYSHSKCRICPYFERCTPEFEANEDVSLIYGIHGNSANHLASMGLSTITQLANSCAEAIPDVPHLKGYKKKHHAILQAKAYQTGEIYQLNDITLPEGMWIHFDIEDNPLTTTHERHVYLWGLLATPYSFNDFDYVWTDDETQDYQGWINFLEKIDNYRTQYSTFVLAHYSNHERTTIRKYAERYAMKDHATVVWLLGNNSPLFDMQKAVVDNLVLPLKGYGLKDICKHKDLVNFQWQDEDSGSQWSVVQFSRFLAATDPHAKLKLKNEILSYNRDDVMATRQLEEWLRNINSSKIRTIKEMN